MTRLVFRLIMCGILLLAIAHPLFAQSSSSSSASSHNYNYNTMMSITPGSSSGSGGDPGGGHAIPRSWLNSMILPGLPPPLFYGGPYIYGPELIDLAAVFNFQSNWTSADFNTYTSKENGKGKIFVKVGLTPSASASHVPFLRVENYPGPQNIRNFNRSYRFRGRISAAGIYGADTFQCWGEIGGPALKGRVDLIIPLKIGGKFRLNEQTIQKIFGLGVAAQSGGSGGATGIMMGFSYGKGNHEAAYDTDVFMVALCFESTGVPYIKVPEEEPKKEQPKKAKADEEVESSAKDEKPNNAKLKYKRPSPTYLHEQQK